MGLAHPWQSVWLLALAGLIALVLWRERQRRRTLETIGALALMESLTESADPARRAIKRALLGAGILFLVLAMMGPQLGARLTPVSRVGLNILLAIDTSKSMLAEDLKPNRLERTKQDLATLVEKLQGNRVGVIAFAGAAFLQCPLTLDTRAANMFLRLIDTDLIPVPGTALGETISLALKSFESVEGERRVLVLLTDGENHEKDLDRAVQRAASAGLRIYALGIGEPHGEPIPLRDATGRLVEYKKDQNGKTIITKLDEAALQHIASQTGGSYYRASPSGLELDRLLDELNRLDKNQLKDTHTVRYENRYQIFGVLAFLCLLLEWMWPSRMSPWFPIGSKT